MSTRFRIFPEYYASGIWLVDSTGTCQCDVSDLPFTLDTEIQGKIGAMSECYANFSDDGVVRYPRTASEDHFNFMILDIYKHIEWAHPDFFYLFEIPPHCAQAFALHQNQTITAAIAPDASSTVAPKRVL